MSASLPTVRDVPHPPPNLKALNTWEQLALGVVYSQFLIQGAERIDSDHLEEVLRSIFSGLGEDVDPAKIIRGLNDASYLTLHTGSKIRARTKSGREYSIPEDIEIIAPLPEGTVLEAG